MTDERRPALGDPIVVRGTKYRIRGKVRPGTDEATLLLRTSFGGRFTEIPEAGLRWDPLAGVWREGIAR